jgi:hypothetical protein
MELSSDAWIEVFSRFHREQELKNVSLVCKYFRDIVKENREFILQRRKYYLLLTRDEFKELLDDLIIDTEEVYSTHLMTTYGYNGINMYCSLSDELRYEVRSYYKKKLRKVFSRNGFYKDDNWYIYDDKYVRMMTEVGWEIEKFKKYVDDLQNFSGMITMKGLFRYTMKKYLSKK